MNPAAEDLFRAAGRPLPRTAQDLVTLTPNSARLQEALLQPPPFDRVDLQTALRLDGNGQVRRLLPRVVPLAPGEAHGGVVVVFSDVTDIVRLDEMRTELIAVASHELQTPVTTLRMSLLMLRESTEQLDERIRDLVRTALGGVDQLGETVAELLDMTRIEAGWLKLSREPVLLNDIVREVVARCQPEADEIGIHLKCSADAGVPLIDGDRARLRMVVENIVHNALKYTPRGGCIEVSTSVERTIPPAGQPGRVVVQVTDNGPGIPLELRNRVFEKFFRVEHYRPGSEDAPRGSGIGLYLCKEIIELHGGSIQCDAAPGGRGTRVVFDLPAPTLGGRE
jgi:NtrC-family two-component system sensor histidine kinase KinB